MKQVVPTDKDEYQKFRNARSKKRFQEKPQSKKNDKYIRLPFTYRKEKLSKTTAKNTDDD